MNGEEYIPTTEDIRTEYVQPWVDNLDQFFLRAAQFDRWLAVHDRQVAMKALVDAKDAVRAVDWWYETTDINFSDRVRQWLYARAITFKRGADDE